MDQKTKVKNIIIELWKKADESKKIAWLSDKQYNWFSSVLAPNQPDNISILVACVLNNGELLTTQPSSAIISVPDEIFVMGYLYIVSTKNNYKCVSMVSKTDNEIKELRKAINKLYESELIEK